MKRKGNSVLMEVHTTHQPAAKAFRQKFLSETVDASSRTKTEKSACTNIGSGENIFHCAGL